MGELFCVREAELNYKDFSCIFSVLTFTVDCLGVFGEVSLDFCYVL